MYLPFWVAIPVWLIWAVIMVVVVWGMILVLSYGAKGAAHCPAAPPGLLASARHGAAARLSPTPGPPYALVLRHWEGI